MSKRDDFSRAKFAALYYLGRRALTERELRDKLAKKEYPPEVCEKTVAYLKELGYIDDEKYSQRFIETALTVKKHGIARIRRELYGKGVKPEIIDSAVREADCNGFDALSELVAEKRTKYDLSDPKQKNRFIGFLLRRGYRYDEIYSALRETEDTYFD
ncbi:MAG: Regulatory protein RecX [Firmicutes bacterium ADurb.Bin193]|nr:MAG: Regulatory protein RecX [Firmicutes bacterium ADurb.Bin193]